MTPYRISVIVPIKNEAENILALHREIVDTCERGYRGTPFEYEILFIDDGSRDKTQEICKTLSPLKYIRFRKSFGQTAAMDAGFHAASMDYIVAMDGDGQNDPTDIPRLLEYLLENDLDVVSGWRKSRKDTFAKRFVSRGANLLRKLLIHDQIHDSGCTLKIYRKECFAHLHLYGEQHRFIPALLAIKGFRIGEIEVNHRPRTGGKTNYSWSRVLKGFTDMVSVWFWQTYASRPLHILGTLGLMSFLLSGGALLWLIIGAILGASYNGLILALLIFLGSLFAGTVYFALGIMSESLMKILYQVRGSRPYEIAEITETKNA